MGAEILIVVAAASHVVATWLFAIQRGRAARRRRMIPSHERPSWPRVSVIVPAWNESSTLRDCVASLANVDYPDWETIVVAGGPDGTHGMALVAAGQLERVTVLEQEPRGKNAALNLGRAAAHGDVVVVLDADSQVGRDWLRALVAPIGDRVQATTGQTIPLRKTFVSRTDQMEMFSARDLHESSVLQGSGSIAVSKAVLDRIGGFPEEVLVGVDWDLDARLSSAGIERAYCSGAGVRTERPATLGEFLSNEMRWRRAHLAAIIHLPQVFLGTPADAFRHLYVYALAWFTAVATALAGFLVAFGEPDARRLVLTLWSTFIAWLLMRRAAVSAGVAAWSGDARWLALSWVLPLLLCLTLAAILPASLTLNRISPHFQGPRPERRADHAG